MSDDTIKDTETEGDAYAECTRSNLSKTILRKQGVINYMSIELQYRIQPLMELEPTRCFSMNPMTTMIQKSALVVKQGRTVFFAVAMAGGCGFSFCPFLFAIRQPRPCHYSICNRGRRGESLCVLFWAIELK